VPNEAQAVTGTSRPRRLIVGITGASGAIYGVRLLARARALGVATHLVASPAGILNVHHELGLDRTALEALATAAHAPGDVGACIASGSFATDAMVIAPCSMKTLAAVAHGLGDNLLTRAADVTLKERRRLVLMVRETPFNLAHLRNMTAVTEMGGIVFPPLPAFYHRPQSIDELVDETVERVLSLLQIEAAQPRSWNGL
jgi:4-hydroxy-3-polyprenylbenzoate decarboxylase